MCKTRWPQRNLVYIVYQDAFSASISLHFGIMNSPYVNHIKFREVLNNVWGFVICSDMATRQMSENKLPVIQDYLTNVLNVEKLPVLSLSGLESNFTIFRYDWRQHGHYLKPKKRKPRDTIQAYALRHKRDTFFVKNVMSLQLTQVMRPQLCNWNLLRSKITP